MHPNELRGSDGPGRPEKEALRMSGIPPPLVYVVLIALLLAAAALLDLY